MFAEGLGRAVSGQADSGAEDFEGGAEEYWARFLRYFDVMPIEASVSWEIWRVTIVVVTYCGIGYGWIDEARDIGATSH